MKEFKNILTNFRTYEEQFKISERKIDYVTPFNLKYILTGNQDVVGGREIIGVATLNNGEEYAVNGIIGDVDDKEYIECFFINDRECLAMTYLESDENNVIIRKMDFSGENDIMFSYILVCYGKVDILKNETTNVEDLYNQYIQIKDNTEDVYQSFESFILTDENNLFSFNKIFLQMLNDKQIKMYVEQNKTKLAQPIDMYELIVILVNEYLKTVRENRFFSEDKQKYVDYDCDFDVQKYVINYCQEKKYEVDEYQLTSIVTYASYIMDDLFKNSNNFNIGFFVTDYMVSNDEFADMCNDTYEENFIHGMIDELHTFEKVYEWLENLQELSDVDQAYILSHKNIVMKVCSTDEEVNFYSYAKALLDVIAEKREITENKLIEDFKEVVAEFIDELNKQKEIQELFEDDYFKNSNDVF